MLAMVGLIPEGDAAAKIQVESWVAVVALQQFDDLAAPKLLCVLLCNVHHQLQVGLRSPSDIQKLAAYCTGRRQLTTYTPHWLLIA